MLYLLQVVIYSALMYGVYMLVLKNRAQHNWSRAYLLASSLLPFIIPFIQLPVFKTTIQDNTMFAEVSAPVMVVTNKITTAPTWSTSEIIQLVYVSIGVLLLCRLVWQYLQMIRYIKQHTTEQIGDAKVVIDTTAQPGSWGNYIFLPKYKTDEVVLRHELEHIRLKHSWDIAWMRLLQCFFWPNIILYVIEKELKIVHEFQADAGAITDKEQYAQTILNTVFNTNQFSLIHTFFQKPLKRRITMLGKKTSTPVRIRLAVMVSILTVLLISSILFVQGCKREPVASTTPTTQAATKETIYAFADKMPENTVDLTTFIGKNLVYPEQARKNGIEGRVVLKFVVNKDGNVQDIQVMRSPDTLLSGAAIDVVKKMPLWKPGEKDGQKVNVYMTLPISFKLDNGSSFDNVKTGELNGKHQGPPFKAIMDKAVTNKAPEELVLDKYTPVYNYVDKMPETPYDYNGFIANNLVYPKEAKDKKIEGRVVIKFVVGADGSIQNPTVVRSADPLLSAAAIDVIKKMPNWTPGEKDGKKVPVYFTLPLMFKLSN